MFLRLSFAALAGSYSFVAGFNGPLWAREGKNVQKSGSTAVPGPRGCASGGAPCAPPFVTFSQTLQPAGSPDDQALVAPLIGGVNGSTLFSSSSTGTVWALDAASGSPLWSYALPAAPIAGFSLSERGDRLFVGDTSGFAAALNATDGRSLWVTDLGNMSFTAPVHNGPLVFFTTSPDGMLRALDAETGAPRWQHFLGPVIIGAPSFASSENGFAGACPGARGCDTLFVPANLNAQLGNTSVFALDAFSGAQRWAADVPFPEENTIIGELAVGGGRVFYCGLSGVSARNASNGRLLWRASPSGVPGNSNCGATPALSLGADTVYVSVFVAGLYALRASDGAVLWAFPGSQAYGQVALDGAGALYYADFEGQLVALSADTGALRWRFNTNLSEPTNLALGWGSLAIAAGPQTVFVLGPPPPPPPPPRGPGAPAAAAAALPPAAAAALGAAGAAALLGAGLLARSRGAAAPPQRAAVAPLADPRARGRSIATSTADFAEGLEEPLLQPPPPLPLLQRPRTPPRPAGGARWATASALPPDFEFEDAERVFVTDAGAAAPPPTASSGAVDDEALKEGDSWVLSGSAGRTGTSRSPAASATQGSLPALAAPGSEPAPAAPLASRVSPGRVSASGSLN